MDKPVLVIMAAGMGSRYGGLKQIDPVDEQGNKIIDFSIYDAVRAGFKKVIFIIKKENEQDFRECNVDGPMREPRMLERVEWERDVSAFQGVKLRAVRVPGLGLLKQYGDWRDDNREWFDDIVNAD